MFNFFKNKISSLTNWMKQEVDFSKNLSVHDAYAHFSENSFNTLMKSRSIAMDLGNEYIETIHYVFADFMINENSIKSFLFENEEEFISFYNSFKIKEPILDVNANIALSKEFENAIIKSNQKKIQYNSTKIEPIHIILASAEIENSIVNQLITKKEMKYADLEKYYYT